LQYELLNYLPKRGWKLKPEAFLLSKGKTLKSENNSREERTKIQSINYYVAINYS
jgi:hypothetical protein